MYKTRSTQESRLSPDLLITAKVCLLTFAVVIYLHCMEFICLSDCKCSNL